MGVAILASVFSANGSYASPQAFADGVVAALPVAAVMLAIGSVIALFVPGLRAGRAVSLAPPAPVEPTAHPVAA